MEYQTYLELVKSRYEKNQRIDTLDAELFYEELFQDKWLATKLKQFSMLSFSERIDLDTVESYSRRCTEFSIDQYKGLTRGMQNGVASFNVIAGNEISQEAIAFAKARPKKHFAAFEMPIIADLRKEVLYYFAQTPMWGAIYYKHFRNYIDQKFDFVDIG